MVSFLYTHLLIFVFNHLWYELLSIQFLCIFLLCRLQVQCSAMKLTWHLSLVYILTLTTPHNLKPDILHSYNVYSTLDWISKEWTWKYLYLKVVKSNDEDELGEANLSLTLLSKEILRASHSWIAYTFPWLTVNIKLI